MPTSAHLPRAFFDRPVLAVARDCIGKILVRRAPEGEAAGRIVECEAYRGPEDLAAHSARGRRTRRNEVMWGPPGRAYVFLLYGSSWAFNLVTGGEGEPHAVLVRAVEPVRGVGLMERRRRMAASRRELTAGPGRLCSALGIGPDLYGADLCGRDVWLEEGAAGPIGRSPRIHVDYAGAWARRPWRFYERGNRWVSVLPRT